MWSMMTIDEKEVFHCPVIYCEGPADNEKDKPIPNFKTRHHAIEAGWKFTTDIQFCPPDEDEVAVCPGCLKTIKEAEDRMEPSMFSK